MQGIVAALLWPDGELPEWIGHLSPWVDMRINDIDEIAARVESQEHRRFLKTHSGADAIPVDDVTRYVVVYRDGRDALVSWANHRRAMRPEVIEILNALAAEDGIAPWPPVWSGDMDDLLEEWIDVCSSVAHLASWWPLRNEANVCFVHYADLLADLEGEMRRIAEFLRIEVDETSWPSVVDRCLLDSMRAAAAASGTLDLGFVGGADAFFNKGTNGRWVGVLTDAQVDRYLRLVADGLPDDAAPWLEHGSRRLGVRPDGAAI
jgi:aryl sulfotransferase